MRRFLRLLTIVFLFSLPAQADFLVEKGTFTINAGTTPFDQSVTVGFQPKALILWATGNQSAEGFTAHQQRFMAFVTGVTDAFCATHSYEDNVDPTSGRVRWSQKAACALDLSGSLYYAADFKSFDVGGFTLTWTTGPNAGTIVHYLAFGGSDITNVKASEHTMSQLSGNQSYTGVGFQGEFGFFLTNMNTARDSNVGSLRFTLGAAISSAKRWCVNLMGVSGGNAAQMNTMRQQVTDHCLCGLKDNSQQNFLLDFSSWDSDGFTLNQVTPPNGDFLFASLVFSGGSFDLGSFSASTSAPPVDDTVSGLAFQPVGVLLSSNGTAAASGIVADSDVSIGASDGTSEGLVWGGTVDSQTPTFSDSRLVTTKVIDVNTHDATTQTIEREADFKQFNSDGFAITWTTTRATADEILWAAFGAEPAGGAVIPKRRMIVFE